MKNQKNRGWQPYIDIVEKGPDAIRETLVLVHGTIYELVIALALVVAKWHPLRAPNQGEVFDDAKYPYMGEETCALCHLYLNRGQRGCSIPVYLSSRALPACCPLAFIGEGCLEVGTVFDKWANSFKYSERHGYQRPTAKTREYTDKMYKLLMKLYAKEYYKITK